MEPDPQPNRYVSDCSHADADPKPCIDSCALQCGSAYGIHRGCVAHWHCDTCGSIRCHGGWWRLKHIPGAPTGLDKVRDAIRAARGGDAPVQIRGYA